MPAGRFDFRIDAGSDVSRPFIWKGPNGAPYDLTGYKARMYIKRDKNDTEAQAEFTTENNGLAIDGVGGRITLSISNEATKTLGGTYVYDLEVIDQLNKVRRIAQGYITVSGEVTR